MPSISALNHGIDGGPEAFCNSTLSRSPALNDQNLASAVEAALRQTGYWQPAEITVSVTQGQVALTGEIEWDFQKRTAIYAVQAVPGVAGIVDNIVLRFVPPTFSSPFFQGFALGAPAGHSSRRLK